MAKKDDDSVEQTAATLDVATLLKLLAQQSDAMTKIANASENGPLRQVPISKAKIKTPWNPEGKKNRPELRRPTYLTGARLREILLSEDEINLLNQVKPGKYHGKRWLVTERDGDKEGSAVDIYLPNKTQEDRLALKGDARDLKHVLEQIIAEQNARETQSTRAAA